MCKLSIHRLTLLCCRFSAANQVDDNSQDGSVEEVAKLQKASPRLQLDSFDRYPLDSFDR